jgi:hypothetical protein
MESQVIPGKMVVNHRDYNLGKLDNLDELPVQPAIFGIFAIIGEEPVNCRYIGETESLREALKDLFEKSHSEGMQKFMQGPWIKMIQFRLMPDSTSEERRDDMKKWVDRYNPNIDNNGEYPGYYDNHKHL